MSSWSRFKRFLIRFFNYWLIAISSLLGNLRSRNYTVQNKPKHGRFLFCLFSFKRFSPKPFMNYFYCQKNYSVNLDTDPPLTNHNPVNFSPPGTVKLNKSPQTGKCRTCLTRTVILTSEHFKHVLTPTSVILVI